MKYICYILILLYVIQIVLTAKGIKKELEYMRREVKNNGKK